MGLPYKLRKILVENYIGIGLWKAFPRKGIRQIMLEDALDKFKKHTTRKYGSMKNYTSELLLSLGFKNMREYTQWLGECYGFESYQELLNSRANKIGFKTDYERKKKLLSYKGFQNRSDYAYYCAKKAGFKSHTERLKAGILKKGFTSWTEYENFLAQKRGFKDRKERRSSHNVATIGSVALLKVNV